MNSTMSNSIKNTSAISQAVSPFLNAEQTAEAVRLWEEKYANQQGLSVQYFARECSNRFSHEAGRSQLVKKLVRELYTQLHALDQIQIRPTTR